MEFFGLVKADERIDPAGRLNFIQFDFFDLLGPRCRLSGFGGVRREAADKGLQFGNLRLFLGIVRQQPLTRLSGSRHVFIIIAWVNP